MAKKFLIPKDNISIEIEVRKSRFICHLAHAETAETARQFIAEINEKFNDATHNCWAFQTEEPGSTRCIGCSDDGEPHGTAGKPMLNVLCHSEVGEMVAVVTRYYGGTKLGTGGLARAYSDSVKAALDKLNTSEKIEWSFSTLVLDYSLQSTVENLLKETGVEIIDSQFGENVTYKLRYDIDFLQEINIRLNNLSQGKLTIIPPYSSPQK